jgi:hypothetical protein
MSIKKQKNKRKKKASSNMSLEMHSRKPLQPNWEHGEVLALIKVGINILQH